jgi:ATP-binding cassette subfamily B (MDR/TAP) protein 8
MLGNDIHVLFLQPTRGRITVSGEDVRTFEKTEWVEAVSIVNQVMI